MYRAHIDGPFFLADHFSPPGTYLVEDVTAAAVLTLRAGWVEHAEFYGNKTVSPDTCLLVRPGGYGDLLFLTPIIAELTRRGVTVTVCTHPRYFSILEGQPCQMAAYPMPEDEIRQFDRVVWMENAVEDSKDETHIIELFAARVNITLTDHRCRYVVTDEERAWAQERFPRTAKPRIAAQIKASADCRNYPDQLFQLVCTRLVDIGYEVVLFGAPGSMRAHPHYICLPAHGLDIRQSAAVLADCDACIAPDSAICHLAGALGIPTVALYGPFPWQARTRYAPSIFAISGKAPCAPCFHHARTDPWVAGNPCSTAKHCVALAEIKPEAIVARVEKMIKR